MAGEGRREARSALLRGMGLLMYDLYCVCRLSTIITQGLPRQLTKVYASIVSFLLGFDVSLNFVVFAEYTARKRQISIKPCSESIGPKPP